MYKRFEELMVLFTVVIVILYIVLALTIMREIQWNLYN